LIEHIKARLAVNLRASLARPIPEEVPSWLRIGSFERAENAGAIMTTLCSEATQSHTKGFRRALAEAKVSCSHDLQTRSAVETLDEAALSELASRPGAVAWQNAVLGAAGQRRLLAVDGTALNADLGYVAFLLHQSPLQFESGLGGVYDPWLQAPFGSAISFENKDVAAQARPVVAEALKIIGHWRPAVLEEMRTACRVIQFVRDPTADPAKIVSFSDNTVPGALFVSVRADGRFIDPYDLADSLIHEHRHQKLYLLERIVPMVQATDIKVKSPWRDDPRPPSGLLHAAFVFVELQRFWMHVHEKGPARLASRAETQLGRTQSDLREAFATLAHCPLTDAGRELTLQLRDASETVTLVAQAC
jgi:uncharacterized protein